MLQLNKVVNIPVHILKTVCKPEVVYRFLTVFLHFINRDIYILRWCIAGNLPANIADIGFSLITNISILSETEIKRTYTC